MKNRFPAQQIGPTDRLRFLWLALGLLCWLFAANGRLDVPLAAWLSPLFLLRFTRTTRPLSGLLWVWLAALIVTIFWLYESNFYDYLHPFSMINLVILAIFLLSFTLMVVPYLLDRLLTPRVRVLGGLLASLIFPLGQVICEYLRTHLVPYGFFFSPAYTQHGNLPLIQLASITGVYGLSFLMTWFASVGNWIWEQHFSWPAVRKTALTYLGVLMLVLLFGGVRLAFSVPSTQTIRVAGVSAQRATYEQVRNVDGGTDRALASTIFTTATKELLDASRQEARGGAKIIVWPELATYTFPEDEATLIGSGQSLARTEHVYLEMAYGVYAQGETTANRAVLIDPEGGVVWKYDKAHPGMTLATVKDGPGIVPTAETPYGRLASVICIDAWYPDLMQQVGNKGIDLMLVPGLEWPGTYLWAPYDTSFRAIEYGYSLIRPAGMDLGMIFDYQGHILASADYYTTDQQIVVAYVPMKGAWTIYGMVGDLFTWLCMASLIGLTAWTLSRSLRKPKSALTVMASPLTVNAEERHEVGTL